MPRTPYPGLEINEDLRQQKAEWFLQRVAWVVLYVLLAAIALGLFGGGPLSHTRKNSADGALSIEYERFLRHKSPGKVRFELAADSRQVRLLLSTDYVERVEIGNVTPQPAQVISGKDAVTFLFDVQPSERITITIPLTPQRVGNLEGWAAMSNQGKGRQSFKQFVYP